MTFAGWKPKFIPWKVKNKICNASMMTFRQKVNETAIRDYNAETLLRTLRDFERTSRSLNPAEQTEALQCILKVVNVHPDKLDLEIFELEGFCPGSQNCEGWLRGLDSNQDSQIQSLECYQLHHPGIVANAARFCFAVTQKF